MSKKYYVVATDENCAYARGFDALYRAAILMIELQEKKEYESVFLVEKQENIYKVIVK